MNRPHVSRMPRIVLQRRRQLRDEHRAVRVVKASRLGTRGFQACALAVALWGAAAAYAQTQTLTREQMAEFLASARIVASRVTDKGVTRPRRVTLTDGSLTHDAVFSTVDDREAIMRFKTGRVELDFVDSYKHTIAAYRVAQLVGVDDMMPVTVERKWKGETGSLSWWIDDVKWDESERRKANVSPPDAEAWNRQWYRMRVFAQLVADTDRNLSNILIGADWKLWMIDFTRAFRRTRDLEKTSGLTRCDRRLLARMRALTKEQLREATRPFIGGSEIDALLARRDRIVEFFEKRAAERGEARVFYD
jgi:hypothetical protein